MSLSPTEGSAGALESYEAGWVAIHKMLRDGGSWSGHETDVCYWNLGDGRFADASRVTGLDSAGDGRGAALVDWDQDGAVDLWLAERTGPRVRFYQNRAPQGRSVALSLEGTRCNRDAIGARVEVELSDGARLVQSLRAGEGYLAQSSKWLHFGLGGQGDLERVTVRWPAPEGGLETFEGLAAGGRYRLVQGTGRAQAIARRGAVALAPSTPEPLAGTERARIPLAARMPLPSLAWLDLGGRPASIEGVSDGPILVNLWASWCRPCVGELKELAAAKAELERAGVTVLALSVDTTESLPAAEELMRALQWPHLSGRAPQETTEVLDLVQRSLLERRRRLPLPASFLLDADGALAVLYKGPVSVEQLVADAALLRASPEEIRAAAAPFPGRWRSRPPVAPLEIAVALLEQRGFETAARELRVRQYEIRQNDPARTYLEIGKVRFEQGRLDEAIEGFRAAADLDPSLFDAHAGLGFALHQHREVGPAIDAYEAALRLDGHHAPTLFNLALAHLQAGNPGAALHQLELLRVVYPPTAVELEGMLRKE